MGVLTEGQHAGEFISSEANKTRSRSTITLLSGEDLTAGAVLGLPTGTAKYVEYNPGNIDGSEVAVGVLFDNTDASAADVECVAILRDAEVNSAELQWFTGATGGEITTGEGELAAVGIMAR